MSRYTTVGLPSSRNSRGASCEEIIVVRRWVCKQNQREKPRRSSRAGKRSWKREWSVADLVAGDNGVHVVGRSPESPHVVGRSPMLWGGLLTAPLPRTEGLLCLSSARLHPFTPNPSADHATDGVQSLRIVAVAVGAQTLQVVGEAKLVTQQFQRHVGRFQQWLALARVACLDP